MKSLQEIATLDPKAQDLLEASGYFNITLLKEHSLNQITDEIVKANRVLEIVDGDPSVDQVREWLLPLQEELGELVETRVDSRDIVTERELLATSFAIPISKQFIEKNDIGLEQLLPGRVRFLSEVDAVAKHTIEEEVAEKQAEEIEAVSDQVPVVEGKVVAEMEPVAESVTESIDTAQEQLANELAKSIDEPTEHISEQALMTNSQDSEEVDELLKDLFSEKEVVSIDKKRILTMDTFRAEGGRVEPLKSAAAEDLTRSARKETNAGKDPSSRRFVRGVLHKGAGSFMGSLFAYLLFVLCMLGGVFLPLLAIIDREKYFWAIFSPALLVLGLIFFFLFTGKASCPICNQKQFRPKRCLKHRNAHHFPLLGYMLPTALHALFFRWFRCIFCGTSVRLKE